MPGHQRYEPGASLVFLPTSKLCGPNEKAMQLKRIVEPYSPLEAKERKAANLVSWDFQYFLAFPCTNIRVRRCCLSEFVLPYHCGKISSLGRNELHIPFRTSSPTCCIASHPAALCHKMNVHGAAAPARPRLIRILAARGKFFISAFPSRSAV